MFRKDIISKPTAAKKASGSNNQGFAYFEDQGKRRSQEDALVCLNNIQKVKNLQNLTPQEIGHRMWSTHKELDSTFKGKAGTTASSNYYDGNGNIITATLADACAFAAVYDKEGNVLKTVRLNSLVHKPTDAEETKRITAMNGIIAGSRVNGYIAVSRAIGDNDPKCLSGYTKPDPSDKRKIVTADSKIDITSIQEITSDISQDQLGRIDIIVTCDGFTDGAGEDKQAKSDHEDYLKKSLNSNLGLEGKKLCEALTQQAIKDGSNDNVSVAVQTIFAKSSPLNTPVFLGVYDGHAGTEASTFVAEKIGTVFRNQCALSKEAYKDNDNSVYRHADIYLSDHSKEAQNVMQQTINNLDAQIKELENVKLKLNERQEVEAAKAMDVVVQALNNAKTQWKEPAKRREFLETCYNILDDAKKTALRDHRDSNLLLRGLQNAINWLSSFISDNPLIKTASLGSVNMMKENLQKMKFEFKESSEESNKKPIGP